MRVLILDTYYRRFLAAHYAGDPSLADAPYDDQLAVLMERSFGTSDAYSQAFRALGHEAAEVGVNCVQLQSQWAAEHGLRRPARALRAVFERGGQLAERLEWLVAPLYRILDAQIRAFKPDVLYLQDMRFHTVASLIAMRAEGRLLVGQIASKPPSASHLRAFDLITTSFPHLAHRFRQLGIDSEYLPLAFDDRVLGRLASGPPPPRSKLVFVGGLDPRVHGEGVQLLDRVSMEFGDAFAVYGYGVDRLPKGSPLRRVYRGEAWGLDMYRALSGGQVALNRHIAAAEGYANNMRLYEATGVGTALLTDKGRNLAELFNPGLEVATYGDAGELGAEARRLLDDPEACAKLGAAGQARTLREHTFSNRVAELAEILEQRLSSRRLANGLFPAEPGGTVRFERAN